MYIVFLLFFLFLIVCYYKGTHYTVSEDVSNSIYEKEALEHKTALVIVPHQDDELNLAGATIKTMVDKGIKVRVVFATTGDNVDDGPTRIAEGINALTTLGVLDEDIIYLGYSNSFHIQNDLHIYNAPEDTVFTSSKGFTQTYGIDGKDEFCYQQTGEHHLFTKNNLREDIKAVLLCYKPDLIFAVDFDRHSDHRYISFLFEEALCSILSTEGNEYFPQVFKGFAYNGSYLGAKDFYSRMNLKGEAPAKGEFLSNLGFETDYPPYEWYKRVRLPLEGLTQTRTLNSNIIYKALRKHLSQGIIHNAKRIINSDQVFFLRPTTSFSYQSKVSASSGNAALVKDFKLSDCDNILNIATKFSGTWIPDEADTQKTLTMEFSAPQTINKIVLYGNSDLDSKVIKGNIQLSNGLVLPFDALEPASHPTTITFDQQENISALTVTLEEVSGKAAGINELEVYNTALLAPTLKFIKIMVNDTFAYDYWISAKKRLLNLTYYKFGISLEDEIILTKENDDDYALLGNEITFGPDFKKAVVKASLKSDPLIYDQIVINKKGSWALFGFKFIQLTDMLTTRLEHVLKSKYVKYFLKK